MEIDMEKFKQLSINCVPMDHFACGLYRIRNPFMKLYPTCRATLSPPGSYHPYGQKWIYTQRICNAEVMEKLIELKKNYGIKFAIDYDDDVWHKLPSYNRCKIDYEENFEGMKKYLNILADKVTCTNEFLKENLSQFLPKDKIVVIPNCLDYGSWRFDKYKYPDELSFFYAGSPTHWDDKSYGDFSKGIVDYLANKNVEVMGPAPWFLKPRRVANWVPVDSYPINFAYNALRCKFVISPIADNYFGKCKSDLKYIECCAIGRVCLCSDISTYEIAHEYQKIPQNCTKKTMEFIVERALKNYDMLLQYQYEVLQKRWLLPDPYIRLFSE